MIAINDEATVETTAELNGIDRLAQSSHVLVIDDDAAGCRLLKARLQSSGYQVTGCCCPRDAQELALAIQPDIVICDICMPDLDGIEFTRWMRQQPSLATTPMLLITGLDDLELLGRGLAAGADDFLSKPINSLELRTRTQCLLRSRHTEQPLKQRATSAPKLTTPAPADATQLQPAERRLQAQKEDVSHILLIDDDRGQSQLLQTYLNGIPTEIHTAATGQAGLDWLLDHSVDLIVTDILLPDMDGYQVIEQVRARTQFNETPILAISVLSDVEDRVKAINMGADDFILKGFSRVEFRARIQRLLKQKIRQDEMRARYREAERRAVTDSLTGLTTHGYIAESLTHELQGARRNHTEHSLIFIDIDHFKAFNDAFGHALGDEVLKRAADAIVASVRVSDTAGRFGGEEFVVSLPQTTRTEALVVAERIRKNIEAISVNATDKADPRSMRITASVGVATFPLDAVDASGLLQCADEAMYGAKQAGRNTVVDFAAQTLTDTAARRVLIVDDEPPNIRLIKAILAPSKYELLTASTGLEALEIARHSHPDVILLDAMMPGMTGFDVCRRLKSEPSTRLIPVILVTALTGRNNKLKSIESGADAFITKPVDKEELRTQVKAFLRNKRTTDALENAETVIFTLAKAVEGRDASTGGHVERVSHYAAELGRTLGLSEGEIHGLRDAGIVHDIGKISIPDAVLMKPGKLDDEERRIIERHVELGYELLKPLRTFADALPAVRHHHERLDGSGYPLGLRGDQIPITAQILAVVDVYDALTTDRVYRKAFTQQKAFEILSEEVARGLHDPKLVEAFFGLVKGQ